MGKADEEKTEWFEDDRGCPTMISWHSDDPVPLHLIAQEILRCNSSDIYFAKHGFGYYNAVIGAKNKEDVLELEFEIEQMDDDMNWNDRMNPRLPWFRGSHPDEEKEFEEGITEWKEKFDPDGDRDYRIFRRERNRIDFADQRRYSKR